MHNIQPCAICGGPCTKHWTTRACGMRADDIYIYIYIKVGIGMLTE